MPEHATEISKGETHMSDFERENGESVAIVKMGKRLPRKECYFVAEETYHYFTGLEASFEKAKKELIITRLACAFLAVICITVAVLA